MDDLDVQGMFDYYLYDYLVKNNMSETAEIFRREVNLNLDPTQPPPVDTPDGFLHEWWVIFYDMFRSRAGISGEPDEGSSVVTEEIMEADEHSEASSTRHHEKDEKLSGDQATSADLGLTKVDCELPSFPSTKLPAMDNEQMPQVLLSSRHQQELLEFDEVESRMGAGLIPPGFGNQVSDPFWLTELQEELEELGESGENSSEESTTEMNKSSNDTIETSVTHAKDNEDEAGASMQTVTSDASKGGSLVKHNFHNFVCTIFLLFLLWKPAMIHITHFQHDLESRWFVLHQLNIRAN